jgi:flagellar protein FlbD
MVQVTRLGGKQITINALHIETIEATPDTIITLTTGNKFIVLEPVPVVVSLVEQYLMAIGLVGKGLLRNETEGS